MYSYIQKCILALCIHHELLHYAAIVSTQIKCLQKLEFFPANGMRNNTATATGNCCCSRELLKV